MKSRVCVITAVAVIMCGGLRAQNVVFQQAGVISADGNVSITSGAMGIAGVAPMGGRTVTGNPFSATEQTHSLQALSDGSHIERTSSVQLSRDSEGRTRREPVSTTADRPAMVTIEDPVAGANYFLDPMRKTANKLPLPKMLDTRIVVPGAGTSSASVTTSGSMTTSASLSAASVSPSTTIHVAAGGEGPQLLSFQTSPASLDSSAVPVQEDLGTQNINGVSAKGTRSTITIPTGQIGNDRPLQVVSERWYSDELGMLVKSSNSDPRFGTTDYELINISRAAPDPTLFQVPADYTVNEPKAMMRAVGQR